MSERRYAARAGISRGAVQKAKAAGRLVLYGDGSIDAAASDARRAVTTDLAKSIKPDPEEAPADAGGAPEGGGAAASPASGSAFMRARTLNEVAKAQERQIRLARMKGELVDRDRALALVFRLARQERDAWVTWPARVAAVMAADLTAAIGAVTGGDASIEAGTMQQILEAHVRAHLDELADPKLDGL